MRSFERALVRWVRELPDEDLLAFIARGLKREHEVEPHPVPAPARARPVRASRVPQTSERPARRKAPSPVAGVPGDARSDERSDPKPEPAVEESPELQRGSPRRHTCTGGGGSLRCRACALGLPPDPDPLLAWFREHRPKPGRDRNRPEPRQIPPEPAHTPEAPTTPLVFEDGERLVRTDPFVRPAREAPPSSVRLIKPKPRDPGATPVHLPVVAIAELRSKGERFRCKPFAATIAAETCLGRQRASRVNRGEMKAQQRLEIPPGAYDRCRSCGDGVEVARQLSMAGATFQPATPHDPSRDAGEHERAPSRSASGG